MLQGSNPNVSSKIEWRSRYSEVGVDGESDSEVLAGDQPTGKIRLDGRKAWNLFFK